eukprot:Nk52_evm12s1073 gene=Nk52_evmTU12s1073
MDVSSRVTHFDMSSEVCKNPVCSIDESDSNIESSSQENYNGSGVPEVKVSESSPIAIPKVGHSCLRSSDNHASCPQHVMFRQSPPPVYEYSAYSTDSSCLDLAGFASLMTSDADSDSRRKPSLGKALEKPVDAHRSFEKKAFEKNASYIRKVPPQRPIESKQEKKESSKSCYQPLCNLLHKRAISYLVYPVNFKKASTVGVGGNSIEAPHGAVELGSIKFSFPQVTGSVLVKNYAYYKKVVLRVTADNWETFVDIPCKYQFSTQAKLLDVFVFEIDLTEDAFAIKNRDATRFQFAVCYEVNGQAFWDNNCTRNYVFTVEARLPKNSSTAENASDSDDSELSDEQLNVYQEPPGADNCQQLPPVSRTCATKASS